MTSTTATYAFPFPDESDPPDGATQIENLANAVDTQLAVTDANVATNAAHVTRAGLLATLFGTAATVTDVSTTSVASITSTAYVYVRDASANILAGNAFIAPPSGSVEVTWGMGIKPGTGVTGAVTVAVLTGNLIGSGTAVFPATDANAFVKAAQATDTDPGMRSVIVTGLTPGSVYNAGVLWRTTTAVTMAGAGPFIIVKPLAV